MSSTPLAILRTGLVTSVGLTAPQSCAAFRAKISNPTETRFIDSGGEWITAHQVQLERPWRGLTKLAKMASMAIDECLYEIPLSAWSAIPMVLCVAERERVGRFEGIGDELFTDVQRELGAGFASESQIIENGRVSVVVALQQARELIYERNLPYVLIAATDSLITWPTLRHYMHNDRLLTPHNSNGFIPGEGAGALLVGKPSGKSELVCTGIGFGVEKAHIGSEEPLRAEGLTQAIRAALDDAACELHELDLRIADVSGEHYYFKETALALGRILRKRKEEFDIWHPAESMGESCAVAGAALIVVADAACRGGYAPGPRIIAQFADDAGQRAAAVLDFRGP